MPSRSHARETAFAGVVSALQTASAILNGVGRALATGITLADLQQELSKLDAVVEQLAGIRNQLWLHQLEAQLGRGQAPADPAMGRGRGGQTG